MRITYDNLHFAFHESNKLAYQHYLLTVGLAAVSDFDLTMRS